MNEQKNLLIVLGEWWERRQAGSSTDTSQKSSGRLRHLLRWLTPNGGTLLLIAVLLLTQNAWARPTVSPAAAPGPSATTVNYQGRLADSGGSPLDGSYGMSFSLWDAATDGNLAWGPENHTAVPVSNGLFSVGLGSQTAGGIPTTTWGGDRYLEITVGGETLSPRELIRSVPVAGMALTLPEHTVDGGMLASTGFGTSNVPLRNFVIRGPVTEPDLTDTTEVDNAVWDLSPIVGDSAEMIVLQVRVNDDEIGSFFRAWPNGEEPNVGNNSPFVRVFQAGNGNSGILWVRCDSNQVIKYRVAAAGSANTTLDRVDVTVIGWVEPAATP